MAFRELIVEIDALVFDTLGDTARIEGRPEPVRGMFIAPWQQPRLGNLKTRLKEPVFEVRVADAEGFSKGLLVTVELADLDGGGEYELVQLEPGGDGLVALVLRKNE